MKSLTQKPDNINSILEGESYSYELYRVLRLSKSYMDHSRTPLVVKRDIINIGLSKKLDDEHIIEIAQDLYSKLKENVVNMDVFFKNNSMSPSDSLLIYDYLIDLAEKDGDILGHDQKIPFGPNFHYLESKL